MCSDVPDDGPTQPIDVSSNSLNGLSSKRNFSQVELSDSHSSMSPSMPREETAQQSQVVSSLPSNAQLVQHMPAAYELPWITGEPPMPAKTNEPEVSYDRSILPAATIVDQLLNHFFMYTSSAYPIVHEPSLRTQAASVCSRGHSSPSDVCLVLCEPPSAARNP